jgi:hypothetical protein
LAIRYRPKRSHSRHSISSGDIAERDCAAVAHRLRFRYPMVMFVHGFGGGKGSLTGAGGSSFAKADFSGFRRGESG